MGTNDDAPMQPTLTVGELFGRSQDEPPAHLLTPASLPAAPPPPHAPTPVAAAAARIGETAEQDSSSWAVRGGIIEPRRPVAPLPEGVDALDYNNPYGQPIERVWFDGRIVYAIEAGELTVDPATSRVAQEYQIVCSVHLDDNGLPDPDPELVPGQYNIYDSVPGMDKYSPIWQFNYVVVPRSYVPNTLRSEADCLRSGYPILRSMRFEN